jgi:hypothetical protein
LSDDSNARPLIIKRKKVWRRRAPWRRVEGRLCGFRHRDDGLLHAHVAPERDHGTAKKRHRRLFQPDDPDHTHLGRGRWKLRGRQCLFRNDRGAKRDRRHVISDRPKGARRSVRRAPIIAPSAKTMVLASVEDALMAGLGDAALADLASRHVQVRVPMRVF